MQEEKSLRETLKEWKGDIDKEDIKRFMERKNVTINTSTMMSSALTYQWCCQFVRSYSDKYDFESIEDSLDKYREIEDLAKELREQKYFSTSIKLRIKDYWKKNERNLESLIMWINRFLERDKEKSKDVKTIHKISLEKEKLEQAENSILGRLLKQWIEENRTDSALQIISYATQFTKGDEVKKEVSKLRPLYDEIKHLEELLLLEKEETEDYLEIKELKNKILELTVEFNTAFHHYLSLSFKILKEMGFMKKEISFEDLEEDEVIEEDDIAPGLDEQDTEPLREKEE